MLSAIESDRLRTCPEAILAGKNEISTRFSWKTERFTTQKVVLYVVFCVDVFIEKLLCVRKNIHWCHLWDGERLKARKEFVIGGSKFRSTFSCNIFGRGGKEF